MGFLFSKSRRDQSDINSEDMLSFINDLFRQHKLVLFSKSFCPYCRLAKGILNKTGFAYHAIELDVQSDGSKIQKEIAKLSGINTVPQLFLEGKFIGDSSTIKKLDDSGKLIEMFVEHGVLRAA